MQNRKLIAKKSQEEIENEIDAWHQTTDFSKVPGFDKGKIIHPKALNIPGRPRVGRKFNVILPEDTIDKIKQVAAKRGIGYQTMVRIIVSEKIKDYE
jgi:predicted DNA binding CopG/RHH family protein